MLGRARGDVPFRHFDVPGIEPVTEDAVDLPLPDFTVREILRKGGLAFEKPLHFDQGGEPPGNIPLEGFGDNRGQRFIAHQNLAVASFRLDIAIAVRGVKDPIAVHTARLHPVAHLFGVLFPLMLRDAGQQVLNHAAVGIFAKFNGRAFELAAHRADGPPEFPVDVGIARQTADIIDDHDRVVGTVLPKPRQHILHGRAVEITA